MMDFKCNGHVWSDDPSPVGTYSSVLSPWLGYLILGALAAFGCY